MLAAGFTELAAQLGAREAAGTRWRRCTRCWPATRRGGCWCSTTRRDRASVAAVCAAGGDGRVLITSRNALWPPGQAGGGAGPRHRTSRRDSWSTAPATRTARRPRALAEAVGGLPLALEQAAAYIQATGGSLAGYLASFRRRRADLLARGEPAGYPGTVAAAWALAFTQLEESAPGRPGCCGCWRSARPNAVPLGLLLQPRPGLAEQLPAEVAPVLVPLLEDELAAGDAVAALRRYSLVRPAGDGAVSVHRLVQAVTADQMPERAGPGVAAGRRRGDRGRDPRRPAAAGDLAGVRRAAAARPGGPGCGQRRHGADRALSRVQRQLRGRPRTVPADAGRTRVRVPTAPSTRTP